MVRWYTAGAMALTDPAPTGAIPEPPWRRPPRGAGRRAPLNREAIVGAALRVLERVGLDDLSMRRVAEELGTAAGSLYWHVGSKGELLELVLDRVIGELELPAPEAARWQDQLKELCRRGRQVFRAHRDVARISLGRIPMGANGLRVMEWQIGLLREAGFPDRIAAHAGDLLALYIGASAFEEGLGLASPTGEEMAPERILKMIGDYLASLPADRFPHLVALATSGELTSGDAGERFELGLDVLIRGLATLAP